MEQDIKKEIQRLMSIKGRVRGLSPREYGDYILKEEGQEGLNKVEKKMAEWGYALNYKSIKIMDFYPICLDALTLLAVKSVFNYDDNKFREMGGFEPKGSLIIRLFTKYFFSFDRVMKEIPNIWRKYYSVGKLQATEYNEERKYAVLRLDGFPPFELWCLILQGFLVSVMKMIVKSEKNECEQVKFAYRGDPFDEFILRW